MLDVLLSFTLLPQMTTCNTDIWNSWITKNHNYELLSIFVNDSEHFALSVTRFCYIILSKKGMDDVVI